jgi:ribonucleotide monophosphatase NagD (HAD superfamily)
LGHDVSNDRILAIGDGVLTDIKGAMGEDIDSLFISGGLAASETRTERDPDPDALSAYLSKEMVAPTYSIGHLR